MIALDTNVLVRALVDDPTAPRQCAAARSLLGKEPEAFVPTLVQAELIWVLESTYGLDKTAIVEVLEHLRDNTAYRLQDEPQFVDALAAYIRGSAGFVDYLILVVAKANAAKLLTFDKRFARADGVQLLSAA